MIVRCHCTLAWTAVGLLAVGSNLSAEAADPKQAEQFNQKVKTIRAALTARDLTKADAQIKELRALAASDEQEQSVVRMELLTQYVSGFWQAVGTAARSMQPPEELPVGKTRILISEVGAGYIVAHVGGQNRRYTIDTVPSGVAFAIAEKWFDKDPKNKLCIGAFYAVDEQGSVEKAKSLWQEAGKAGVDVKDLLPLITNELKK